MPEKAWKANERMIAEKLGGKRVPVSGRTRGDKPDIEHSLLSPEVKLRARLPAWWYDAMDQAKKSAEEGQVPCTVFREKGKRVSDSFVTMRLRDFVAHFLPKE